jgi:hypothetical protein
LVRCSGGSRRRKLGTGARWLARRCVPRGAREGGSKRASRAGRRPRPPVGGPATLCCRARRPAGWPGRGGRGAAAGVWTSAAAIAALAAAHRAPGRGSAGRWGLGRRGRLVRRPAGRRRDRDRRFVRHPAPATTAGAMASAACKTAVDRANTMLASTVKLRRALAEQARILRDPTNRRLSGPEVLEKLAPWLQAGRASRPGSTGPWPITGGSWTSASCRPPEPGGQVRAPGWQRRSRWTGSARRWRRSPRRRSPAAAPGSGWGSRRRRSGTGPWDTARSAGR